MTIRVFLVDDHELVRRGIREVLGVHQDIEVVGEAGTAEEAMSRISTASPDVAVLDVRLGDDEPSGIELCRDIRSQYPDVACVMLTAHADDDALMASVMAGAAGYLLKQIRGPQLVDAVHRVAAGESLLDPHVVTRVLDRLRAPVDDPLAVLTPQERSILDLIAQGRTNRQIGEELFLAEKTVKNYVSNLLAKLGLHRRTEAAALAVRLEERRRRDLR